MSDSNVAMASENISKKILEQAEKVREMTLQEAEKKAEEIITNARKNAEEKKRKLIKQGIEDLERFKEQELIKIRIEYKKKIYEHAWSLIDSIISSAILLLERIREQEERYNAFLSKAIVNALNMIDEEEVIIHIDKRDEKVVKDIIQLHDVKRFKIVPDLVTAGGLIIMSENGFQEVNETIENRIKQYYKPLREELHNLLFGDLKVEGW